MVKPTCLVATVNSRSELRVNPLAAKSSLDNVHLFVSPSLVATMSPSSPPTTLAVTILVASVSYTQPASNAISTVISVLKDGVPTLVTLSTPALDDEGVPVHSFALTATVTTIASLTS